MSLLTFITKRVSKRPIIQDRLLDAVNKELVPVVIDLIAAANRRVFTTTFGDGAAVSFTVEHGLASRNLVAQVRNTSTGLVVAPSSITFGSDDAVTVVMGAPPAADELTLVVMK